jgi:hypothetical protein
MTAQAYSERSIVQGGEPLELTLIDGERVPYRLSMDSLAALEVSFGSLLTMQQQIQDANRALSSGEGPSGQIKMMAVVTDLVAMGVRHVKWTDPVTGQAIRLGRDRQLVAELLAPARLQEYMTTCGKALQQAFGTMQEGSANPPVTPPASPPQASPGAGGGTSQPLSGDVPMPPFGP